VGPRTGLGDVEKRKFLPLPGGSKSDPACCPSCSWTLYRLSYLGSIRTEYHNNISCTERNVNPWRNLSLWKQIKKHTKKNGIRAHDVIALFLPLGALLTQELLFVSMSQSDLSLACSPPSGGEDPLLACCLVIRQNVSMTAQKFILAQVCLHTRPFWWCGYNVTMKVTLNVDVFLSLWSSGLWYVFSCRRKPTFRRKMLHTVSGFNSSHATQEMPFRL
jgi:hypothetical protein